jgi:hypothetical protein
MMGMHMFLVVAAVLAVALMGVLGALAVVGERVPSVVRPQVLRPRLWGTGRW